MLDASEQVLVRDESPEHLRQRARKARELAEMWHEVLIILASELELLAANREAAQDQR